MDECRKGESTRPPSQLCSLKSSPFPLQNLEYLPRLISSEQSSEMYGSCCRTWACMATVGPLLDQENEQNLQKNCHSYMKRTTPWTACSKQCGLGISMR
ncbi:hypothetical protein Ciccas_003514 [Cichlidogyrus casuarinus]|uniref:CCN TSP1 domain-containing protein n=1 Tax=Cichlidogyrus casuarinus TaxID=1844966 RepID=A0ABD2QE57_9PLAT